MNRRPLFWLFGAIAVGLVFWILSPLFAPSTVRPAGPAGLAGQAAPVFAMLDDRGKPASLDGYRGRVVVMNLWASWCPPCRAEMPDLQRLADAYRGTQLVIVGVNEGESPQRAREFAAALGIDFPIWIDESQRYGRVYAALGLPTTIVVGRDGRVVRGYDGALSYDQMRAAVAGLVRTR
ncbi:MAG TPA: TlpA disulfide reductase family protein [Candidatus Baltobacteraceae bacterium]|nr:TlpA disulfide reductase family protein [Candidatus Baltobacteraceae bacterium]